MNIRFAKITLPTAGAFIVTVAAGRKLSPTAARIDARIDGALKRAMAAGGFDGKSGQFLSVLAPKGTRAARIVAMGIGDPKSVDAEATARLGGQLAGYLIGAEATDAAVAIDPLTGSKLSAAEAAAGIAHGISLRSYRFDKYLTKKREGDKPPLRRVTVMTADPTKARAAHRPLSGVADGVFLTRDLVSEPANVLYPATLAAEARKLTKDGVKVDVFNEARMRKLGMGSLLGVGQGSERESRMVIMQWNGAPRAKNKKPLAFIGKGVTFDTGGISIKPSGGMEDMKWDMGGAGVVIGLMRALARRKAKANVIGAVGLVENMPSGTAQRPGDVVTSMSGQTIEVINTDAEGRLVLADVMWYTQDRFKPRFMIDLATLTGAIIVSLGNDRAGLFCNDDTLSKRLVEAGDKVGERVWPMPIDDVYDKYINSDIADMKNVGGGRAGGSITAAKFIQRFVNNVPWAHLDIAGVTWSKKDTPLVPKGGTAFGVRLLDHLVATHYEGG